MTRQKYCKQCELVKPIDDFYAAGKSFQSRCKGCHVIHRRELRQAKPKKIRLNGFLLLPEETRTDILKYLNTIPVSKLAEKFNLNKHTLTTWKTRGQLVNMTQLPLDPFGDVLRPRRDSGIN